MKSQNSSLVGLVIFWIIAMSAWAIWWTTYGKFADQKAAQYQLDETAPIMTPKTVSGSEGTHAFGGYPELNRNHPRGIALQDIRVLENIGYSVGYSKGMNNPAWACYRLTAGRAKSTATGSLRLHVDGRLGRSQQGLPRMFNRGGWQEGYLAPPRSIGWCHGDDARRDTFVMTNVTLRQPDLGDGLWATMEQILLHEYAPQWEKIFVVVGPVFDANHAWRELPGSVPVAIPTGYYCITIRPSDSDMLGILIPAKPPAERGKAALARYLTSVNDIEDATGLVFFPQLGDISARKAATPWKLW
jgi:endonuclease G